MTRFRIIQKIYELKAEASDIPEEMFSDVVYNYLNDIEDFVKMELVFLTELVDRLEKVEDLSELESIICGLKELL